MSMQFANIARQAASDRQISAGEILELRRAGWSNGTITPDEAEAIFALNNALDDRDDAWVDFFVEAIGHYVLDTMEPRGYLSQDNADWLIAHVDHSGFCDSMAELELLVRTIERANNVPESLKTYVLKTIEREVLHGVGPTRGGGELSDTHVTSAECAIIRRTIFGMGSDRPAAVSQREAEMLFRIKDACIDAENAPEWQRLFVQGVGNFLMGFAAENAQISHERATELQRFMADTTPNVGRFMGRVAKGVPNGMGIVFGRKQAAPSRQDHIDDATEVTAFEKAWLGDRIEANGEIDAFDRALLDFIAEERSITR